MEKFVYPPVAAPALPSWEAFGSMIGAGGMLDCFDGGDVGGEEGKDAAREARHAEELRRNCEQAHARGFEEGRAAERTALAATIDAQQVVGARQSARLLEAFHAERERYFESVEQEVVKLALAVTARILRREAQMDPLLLSGAVRVALGQLSATTRVRLVAPAADLELWTDAIAHMPNLSPRPTVVAGEDMHLGECILETELGSVDLGISAQLAEIERGFFDRTARNPIVATPTTIGEDMTE